MHGLPTAAPADLGLCPERTQGIVQALQRDVDRGRLPGAVLVLARHLAPAAILSVEANGGLLDNIRALHAHNGVSDLITLRHGVVLSEPDAPAEVEFFVMGNFLGSGLTARNPDRAQSVTVPVIRYEALKREFPHDAIMMDIEGGELEFLRHADLSGVKVLVLAVIGLPFLLVALIGGFLVTVTLWIVSIGVSA